jgi:hypothetical protein
MATLKFECIFCLEDKDEKIEGRGAYLAEDAELLKDENIVSAKFQLGLQLAMMEAAEKFNNGLNKAKSARKGKES